DPALVVLRRAERRAVVEVGPAIPVAVPRLFERDRQPVQLAAEPRRPRRVSLALGQHRELPEDLGEEPPQPHALATALVADAVHAVVPVADSDQRQTVRSGGETALDRTHAVVVERGARARN